MFPESKFPEPRSRTIAKGRSFDPPRCVASGAASHGPYRLELAVAERGLRGARPLLEGRHRRGPTPRRLGRLEDPFGVAAGRVAFKEEGPRGSEASFGLGQALPGRPECLLAGKARGQQ